MASTINADDGVVSGSAGVKTSADNSGVLELQSNGTTQFTLGSSSVVINEAGADVDFRVEGDTDSNLLFVDASTDRVGVGTGTPGSKLDVNGNGNFSGTLGATLPSSVGSITLRNSSTTSSELHVRPASGKDGWISFTEDTVADRWIIGTKNGNGSLFFNTGSPGSNTDRVILTSAGDIGIATTSPSAKLEAFGTDAGIIVHYTSESRGGIFALSTQRVALSTTNSVDDIVFGYGSSPVTSAGFVERMRLDNGNGRLGIGITAPAATLDVRETRFATIRVGSTGNGGSGDEFGNLEFYWGDPDAAEVKCSIYAKMVGNEGPGGGAATDLLFATRPIGGSLTERARITSGGTLIVGATATSAYFDGTVSAFGQSLPGMSAKTSGLTNMPAITTWNTQTTGDNWFIEFATETTAASRGTITYNRTGGVVAYNTTSDYRAKNIIGPIEDTGTTIDALKVYTGKMKDATVERPMLIAHEAQEVVPYAVTGEKDAVNKDGTPRYQQMDHQVLVPLLIAEIQSLRARVAALESK